MNVKLSRIKSKISGVKRKPEGSPEHPISSPGNTETQQLYPHALKKSKSDLMAPTIIASSTAANDLQAIREKETVRLILQALSDLGFSKSVAQLENESGMN